MREVGQPRSFLKFLLVQTSMAPGLDAFLLRCTSVFCYAFLCFHATRRLGARRLQLVLLFLYLRGFESARGEAAGRGRRIKGAVWALWTLLTALFAARVDAHAAGRGCRGLGLWVMSSSTATVGFSALLPELIPSSLVRGPQNAKV